MEILGDLFAAPEFRDIDLERQIIVEEILEDLDDRGRNVNLDDQSRRQVWGEHPLGFPITGPLRNVRRFTTRDVRAHFQRFYGATNMVLAVAGPIRMRTVERQSRAAFARRPARRAARARGAPRPAGPGPLYRAVHNESAQTQVHILFHALPETDPDYLALRALVRVLDDGMSTRLHYQICDQKGLAYSIAGSLHSYHDAALLEIDAACAHAKLPALIGESLGMLGPLPRRARRRGRARQGEAPLRQRHRILLRRSRRPVRLVRRHRALHARRAAGEAGARARPRPRPRTSAPSPAG